MKIAIIPARGGSKRIPHKNIRTFRGKPLIGYSIETALQSKCFDRVIVSTDSKEIARIAESFDAEVPFMRPAALADDHTGTGDVMRHALNWMRENGQHFEFVCCIYATAPFLQPEDLRSGLQLLEKNQEKQFAFSVSRFPYPVQRGFSISSDNIIIPLQPECLPYRSQDLEEAYHDAGQFYWGRSQAFLDNLSIFSTHSIPVVLPSYRVQDIDTLDDWVRAEYLHQAIEMAEKTDVPGSH